VPPACIKSLTKAERLAGADALLLACYQFSTVSSA
jgi:hypothetical protein